MSKMNMMVHLNGYADSSNTNSPSLNNFRWNREYQGISISEPTSRTINIPSGDSLTLFSGSIPINSDITTTYDIALKSGTSNTYVISHNSGTAPNFRTSRISGADDTTEVTVTKNAKLLTFTSSNGTLFDLINNGILVGDMARIGDGFNISNRGEFKILARTATSFTIENESGAAEIVVLGADYALDINIYSSSGVQINDKIEILEGFSSVINGTYEITDVSHNYIEFYCADSLPSEVDISNDPTAFTIYREAKQFIYIEADQRLEIYLNDSVTPNIVEPIAVGTQIKPGIFMLTSTVKKIVLSNTTIDSVNIFVASAE